MQSEFIVRDYTSDDRALVYDSFTRNLASYSPFFAFDMRVIIPTLQTVFGLHMNLETNRIRVFCPIDDEALVMGWAMSDAGTHCLHYCYVKQRYRTFEVGKELIDYALTRDKVTSFSVWHPGYAYELNKQGLEYAPDLFWDKKFCEKARNHAMGQFDRRAKVYESGDI